MPELPEVETVRRTLERQLKDVEIVDVNVRYAKTVENDCGEFCERVRGEVFRSFERRGKYLLLRTDHELLSVHLRMEGKFYIQQPMDEMNRHMHVIFTLKDGRELRFHDTRKFGRMRLLDYNTDLTHFHDLGPEPFQEEFNGQYVYEKCHERRIPVKSLLLEQSFVAGIGNIYASEILYAAGIRPGRSTSRITHRGADDIAFYTKRILAQAIEAGGTTIRSYTSSLGVTGRFQLSCAAYGQKVCEKCGGPIHIKVIGGRSSYYCPNCQK